MTKIRNAPTRVRQFESFMHLQQINLNRSRINDNYRVEEKRKGNNANIVPNILGRAWITTTTGC